MTWRLDRRHWPQVCKECVGGTGRRARLQPRQQGAPGSGQQRGKRSERTLTWRTRGTAQRSRLTPGCCACTRSSRSACMVARPAACRGRERSSAIQAPLTTLAAVAAPRRRRGARRVHSRAQLHSRYAWIQVFDAIVACCSGWSATDRRPELRSRSRGYSATRGHQTWLDAIFTHVTISGMCGVRLFKSLQRQARGRQRRSDARSVDGSDQAQLSRQPFWHSRLSCGS